MRFYTESDCDRSIIADKTIAVVGYGNQGRPQALNMRDNGLRIIIGAREGGGKTAALADGFEAMSIADAARKADILMMLLPDEIQGEIFKSEIEGALSKDAAICFAHGFAVAFGEIADCSRDVILVAPKGQGRRLREAFVSGSAIPCFIAVENDSSGKALDKALALASAIGCLRAGAYETSFREEAVSDIFGEQAVLCGGVPALVKEAFDVLVEKGFSPEIAYFECLQELEIIVDLMVERGIAGMRDIISGTAAYGSLAFGERLIDRRFRRNLESLFEKISSGKFAASWLAENRKGCKNLQKLREKEQNSLIEITARKVRERSSCSSKSPEQERKGSDA